MPLRKLRNYFFTPTSTPSSVGYRFVNQDEPVQQTYEELFDSAGFISENEDKAKNTEQGFVRTTPNTNAKSNTPPDTQWSYSTSPEQLPEVKYKASERVLDEPDEISVADTKESFSRNVFAVSLTKSFKDWLFQKLVPVGGLTNQILTKLTDDDYDYGWQDAEAVEGLPSGGVSTDVLSGSRQWESAKTVAGLDGGLTGQALVKDTDLDGEFSWKVIPNTVPLGGTSTQVLTKNTGANGDYSWSQIPSSTYSASIASSSGMAVYKGTSGNDFEFRNISIDPLSSSKLTVAIDATSDTVALKLNQLEGSDVDVPTLSWGSVGAPDANDVTSAFQNIINKIDATSFGSPVNNQVTFTLNGGLAQVINHGFGKYPSTRLINDEGEEFEANITHNSSNQITITSDNPLVGIAVLD